MKRTRSRRAPLLGTTWTTVVITAAATAHPPDVDQRVQPPANPPHPRAIDVGRFHTNRDAAALAVPDEGRAFTFAIFGDRTGGPAEGVEVLARAVREVNLLEPDLVMTVGDLVEGYNDRPQWTAQMREFKGIMDGLLMPWFPVAGNHDIYWRGDGPPPPGEHESSYERHFGPLWYAFDHKGCTFLVLYSDEGDPTTGRKSINEPAAQTMSPAQFAWLRSTLDQAGDARHVFVFLHHPRWLGGGYGDDWQRVHDLLVAAGNVRAVFAGHIHRMRYDGPRDGIEYVTLATTGGSQSALAPAAGYLHHFNLVTVRDAQIAHAAVPVGPVIDIRGLTGEVSAQAARLAAVRPAFDAPLAVASDGSVEDRVTVTIAAPPGAGPCPLSLSLDSRDSRWRLAPDHEHGTLEPGRPWTRTFRVARDAGTLDDAFRPIEVVLHLSLAAQGHGYAIPEIRRPLPLRLDAPAPAQPILESVMDFDGHDDCLRVDSDLLDVPDGPLTLECWFAADAWGRRTGLVAKTESSEYGFFVSNAVPSFSIFLGDRYVNVKAPRPMLRTRRWHHLAGVYDGRQTRLYVDGDLVDAADRAGPRRANTLPLLIGADVNGRGEAMSHFDGRIDAVRLSTTARYTGSRFTPQRRHAPDAHTVLLVNMDGALGPWVFDESASAAHPVMVGAPQLVPVR